MEKKAHRKHDINDEVWELLKPHLPGQIGQWGRVARDNRTFINAVFWILRAGAPWRDLPPDYGKWGTNNQRFNRRRTNGTWEKLMNLLVNEPDYEWLMIDASHIKVHPHAAGAKGRQ
jgi:transposase